MYISPSVLSTEILFSRNLMLFCSSQMSPNVLKAILNYKEFLSSFSTLVTTLQPLLTYLAITLTLILPFLFPVKKAACTVPILLAHNTDSLFKYSHSVPWLSCLSSLHGTLHKRNLSISVLLNILKYNLVLESQVFLWTTKMLLPMEVFQDKLMVSDPLQIFPVREN